MFILLNIVEENLLPLENYCKAYSKSRLWLPLYLPKMVVIFSVVDKGIS